MPITIQQRPARALEYKHIMHNGTTNNQTIHKKRKAVSSKIHFLQPSQSSQSSPVQSSADQFSPVQSITTCDGTSKTNPPHGIGFGFGIGSLLITQPSVQSLQHKTPASLAWGAKPYGHKHQTKATQN
ncbi:hypothetical protein N7509_001269 [Penicillium cosmopolitanum]|uniref:Uncharacterized protein n=1 Tax=Penicillium cosmopolitanum TaxID=1131564 RepID=A0A9W9WCA1_9EURO|nr:uncharacterized protein N7509_001269 [Penicillium cosmopolitanum]KAJ5414642.1 hypothetical protein N7509_001269 [Penicillium cosmopolitanum]